MTANFGLGEPPADTSLQDVVIQLDRMESRLNDRLTRFSLQLDELCKTKLVSFSQKKRVSYNFSKQARSHEHQAKDSFSTTSASDEDALESGKQHMPGKESFTTISVLDETPPSNCRSQSDPSNITPNLASSSSAGVLLPSMPSMLHDVREGAGIAKQIDVRSNPSRPVWKKFGTKPSEAAKEFVRDALTKAQKRKLARSIRHKATLPLDTNEEENSNQPLPGIDVMLKDTDVNANFSETVTGWWNPDSDSNNMLIKAAHKAERMKDDVYDLLLSKGWLAPQPILSRRLNVRIKMTRAERLVTSARFEMVCSLMIIANAVFLGYQTQYSSNPANDGISLEWLKMVQIVFTSWFAVEVTLRFYAWRLNFFVSKDWRWNLFDLTVVSISVIEIALERSSSDEGSSNFAIVRMIRILRVVRAVRFIRVVRFFAELRMMIYSSLKSVKPFFWALGILLMIVYVFAIVTTQIVSDYRREHHDEDLTAMLKFFGSLHESVYTLFMVISGGVSWIEPANELILVHWSFKIWMSLYVAFVMFAVLNIVTGIFIESALKSAQDDQDVVIQEEMNHEDSLAQGFLEVFQRCDDDKSGYIDAEEFDTHLSDYRVRAFLHHLGLDIPEAQGLFRLLDIGGVGKVYAKEFVLGCQQLKGPAKNVDVATLLFQNKRMMTLWAVFMSYVEDQFAVLVARNGDITSKSISQRSAELASKSSSHSSMSQMPHFGEAAEQLRHSL